MKVLVGDMFESHAQTLVNTVNCVGVMGKGIAHEFKKRFPDMFEDYVERCERGEVRLGVPYLYRTIFPPQIVNFPTKDHWKSVSRIEDIEHGLQYLLAHYREWEITSLAMPPLGCGNGQLEWREVGPLIYRYALQVDIPVQLYAPYGTRPAELTIDFLSKSSKPVATGRAHTSNGTRTALDAAWVALVEILQRIESQPYHWPVGRTVFQKIAYVAAREGLPLSLDYRKGSFGPFSDGLKEIETRLVNSNLLQEKRSGRMFRVLVGPNFERVRKEYESALSKWTDTIDKTTDLFARMDTNQAEITATVLFATDALAGQLHRAPTEREVLSVVVDWKQRRKPPIDETEVASTIRNLAILDWLKVKYDPELPLPIAESA